MEFLCLPFARIFTVLCEIVTLTFHNTLKIGICFSRAKLKSKYLQKLSSTCEIRCLFFQNRYIWQLFFYIYLTCVFNIPSITEISTRAHIDNQEGGHWFKENIRIRSWSLCMSRYLVDDNLLIMYNLPEHDRWKLFM